MKKIPASFEAGITVVQYRAIVQMHSIHDVAIIETVPMSVFSPLTKVGIARGLLLPEQHAGIWPRRPASQFYLAINGLRCRHIKG